MLIDMQILIIFNLNMIALETLLSDLEKGKQIDVIDELVIYNSNDFRWKNSLSAMIFLCNKYRVKKIHFAFRKDFYRIGNLDKIPKSCEGDLPYLKFIEIDYLDEVQRLARQFIIHSRAMSIKWNIKSNTRNPCEDIMWGITESIKFDDFHLIKVSFTLPKIVTESAESSYYRRKLSHILDRNIQVWHKCQMAIITLLGLVKKKLIILNRDIMNIIVAMLWNVRRTKYWL